MPSRNHKELKAKLAVEEPSAEQQQPQQQLQQQQQEVAQPEPPSTMAPAATAKPVSMLNLFLETSVPFTNCLIIFFYLLSNRPSHKALLPKGVFLLERYQ